MPKQKYIFKDNKMIINPEWEAENNLPVAKVVTDKNNEVAPLAVACSMTDLLQMQNISDGKVHPSESAIDAINTIQETAYKGALNVPEEEEMIDTLSAVCEKYGIAFGLMSKILKLKDQNLNMIIDDSGSMDRTTDSKHSDAGEYMQKLLRIYNSPSEPMTRWQEVENHLHNLIGILAYVPTKQITISFLNRPNTITLTHAGKTPKQYQDDADAKIRSAFVASPDGFTPTYNALAKAFNTRFDTLTVHYLFTDGEPSDINNRATPQEIARVKALINQRLNPKSKPLVMVSCTNEDEHTKWMKIVEKEGPSVSETDDYNDEKEEVIANQGKRFPYNKGLWYAALLAGAIDQELDGLDDTRPLTRFTLQNLFGSTITDEDYKGYFDSHPNGKAFTKHFKTLATAQKTTMELFGEEEAVAATTSKFSMFSLKM